VAIEPLLRFGNDPAGEILLAARQCRADLIVMGTHRRACLGWLPLGSVAEQVLRQAPCPVVTVRAQAAEAGQPRQLAAVVRPAAAPKSEPAAAGRP
jgi:hypothetical protein